MTHMIKAKDDKLTEEIVASMIGKYIHAPTNMHEIRRQPAQQRKPTYGLLVV